MPQCRAMSKRSKMRCQMLAMEGKEVCHYHGGKSPGQPIKHALYSKFVPEDWRETYDYFASDPDWTSSRKDIALACTNLARWVEMQPGGPLDDKGREELKQHLGFISKFREREAKRLHDDRVVDELLAKQVAEESRILREILSGYLDRDTTERVLREFADRLGAAADVVSGSVSL